MNKEKTIKICENHPHYKVPLIWTFAFPGEEYWCPYCDYTHGMLGAGKNVKETETLKKRLKAYIKATKQYLHANAILCCSETKYKGKWIKPHELPEKEKKRLAKIRESYKFNQRVKI